MPKDDITGVIPGARVTPLSDHLGVPLTMALLGFGVLALAAGHHLSGDVIGSCLVEITFALLVDHQRSG